MVNSVLSVSCLLFSTHGVPVPAMHGVGATVLHRVPVWPVHLSAFIVSL